SITTSRTSEPISFVAETDQSFDVIDGVYSSLGNLVGSYTPTEFKLNVDIIYLYRINEPGYLTMLSPYRWPGTENQPELSQADFTEDIVLVPDFPVRPGEYNGMGFYFGLNRAVAEQGIYDGVDTRMLKESVVTVSIPGYEDVWTDTSTTLDLSSYGFGIYETRVKNADGSLTFGPSQLQPGSVEANYGLAGVERFYPINNFIFAGSDCYAVLPGEDGHPDSFNSVDAVGLYNNLNPPGPVFSGDMACIVLPFSGIIVPDFVPEITFIMSWNLENIIEVYDAGTPDEKSDDIMVFAKDFWTRFNLSVSY
ncbi:MAG: hypothetical protein DRP47_11185, partial [Candidatus Zixiibacteriota bacterium]